MKPITDPQSLAPASKTSKVPVTSKVQPVAQVALTTLKASKITTATTKAAKAVTDTAQVPKATKTAKATTKASKARKWKPWTYAQKARWLAETYTVPTLRQHKAAAFKAAQRAYAIQKDAERAAAYEAQRLIENTAAKARNAARGVPEGAFRRKKGPLAIVRVGPRNTSEA